MEVGTEGLANSHIDIIGLLVSNNLSAYVQSITPYVSSLPKKDNKYAHWYSTALAPGQEITLFVITNGKSGVQCH